jgi:hypothetical protein
VSSSVESLLLDTDVLIDFLRGRAEAVAFLAAAEGPLIISAISVAELFAGARGEDGEALRTFLGAFEVVPVDTEIAAAGGMHRGRWGTSHGTGLADALIAACAEAASARLVTRNRKHLQMLEDVLVPY